MSQSSPTNDANPRIRELEEEIEYLRDKLSGQDPDAVVQRHIDLLHTYNEIKDGTQALIGKYAYLTKTTVTAVHDELGLPTVEKK